MNHTLPTGARAPRKPNGAPAFTTARLVMYVALAGVLLDQLLR